MTLDQPPRPSPALPTGRTAVAAVALAVFAGAMWAAWLGWDHDYYLVDGVPQGPYRAWQVAGCGLAVVVGTVAAYLWVRHPVAVAVLPAAAALGFALPWALDAARTDESGLWVVGLVLLLGGAGAGLTVVVALCLLIPDRRRSRVASAG